MTVHQDYYQKTLYNSFHRLSSTPHDKKPELGDMGASFKSYPLANKQAFIVQQLQEVQYNYC